MDIVGMGKALPWSVPRSPGLVDSPSLGVGSSSGPGGPGLPHSLWDEHMAAVQTARHARKRSPHYEQRDAIFALSKWQSVFVIQPYFGEGVT